MNPMVKHYIEAAEWALATLEETALLASSSRSRINRQISICARMLAVVWSTASREEIESTRASRVKKLAAKIDPKTPVPPSAVLSEWADELQSGEPWAMRAALQVKPPTPCEGE